MKFWQNALLATVGAVGMAFSANGQTGIGPGGEPWPERNPDDGRQNNIRTEDCRIQTRAEILVDNPWLDKNSLMKNKHNNDNYRLDSVIWHEDYADMYTMFYSVCGLPEQGRSANYQAVYKYNNIKEQEENAKGEEYFVPIRSQDDQMLAEQLVISAAIDPDKIPLEMAEKPPYVVQIVALRDFSPGANPNTQIQTNYLDMDGEIVGQRLSEIAHSPKDGRKFMDNLLTESGFGSRLTDPKDGVGEICNIFINRHRAILGFEPLDAVIPNRGKSQDPYFAPMPSVIRVGSLEPINNKNVIEKTESGFKNNSTMAVDGSKKTYPNPYSKKASKTLGF